MTRITWSASSGTWRTSSRVEQWFFGSDARGSEVKNLPMSTSNGCTDFLMSFSMTTLPSATRVASNRCARCWMINKWNCVWKCPSYWPSKWILACIPLLFRPFPWWYPASNVTRSKHISCILKPLLVITPELFSLEVQARRSVTESVGFGRLVRLIEFRGESHGAWTTVTARDWAKTDINKQGPTCTHCFCFRWTNRARRQCQPLLFTSCHKTMTTFYDP